MGGRLARLMTGSYAPCTTIGLRWFCIVTGLAGWCHDLGDGIVFFFNM